LGIPVVLLQILEKGTHIISVCWYKIYPAIMGGQKGIVLFNEALQKAYKCTCICSNNNEVPYHQKEQVLPILPTGKKQFFNYNNYKKILSYVKKYKSKLVIIEHPYYWPISLFKKQYGFQVMLHSHNVEYKRAKALGKWYWRFIYIWEKWAYQKADIILFKTAIDQLFMESKFGLLNQRKYILPYCTNIAEIPTDKNICKEQLRVIHTLNITTKILLFVGSFNYAPNQIGLTHLLHNILPELRNQISDFKILICGLGLEPFIAENKLILPEECIAVGAVSDMDFYFRAADIFINPVTIGEGIQTKNIDALANNCTIVGYTSVANGIPDYIINRKAFFANTNNTMGFVSLIKKVLDQKFTAINPQFYLDFSWEKRISDIFLNFE
jgi:polysaccharide biosynthesis protein PslH